MCQSFMLFMEVFFKTKFQNTLLFPLGIFPICTFNLHDFKVTKNSPSVIMFAITLILSPHTHPESAGERGLEVRCDGDRPPLPVDLCVCVRLRHDGHVPAAALPELHSQDHQQPARLTAWPRTR